VEHLDCAFDYPFLADNYIRVSRDGTTTPSLISPDPHVVLQAELLVRFPIPLPQVM
jgi:hypothetical protein